MTNSWKRVWDARQLDTSRPSTLARLMAADGLDTGFGDVSEANWRTFVAAIASELDIGANDRVFEVGCGAGAFLYELWRNGAVVTGVDQSAALVGYAREAMPTGKFAVGDAADIDPADQHDIVVACGVLLYFPDLDYASRVVAAMCRKARRAVAILDNPDATKREAAMALRRAAAGGAAAYEARYRGLDHLYFDKEWMRTALEREGMTAVRIEDQRIAGYTNAAYRFNAIAFRK